MPWVWLKVTNEDVSMQDLKLEPSRMWEGACGEGLLFSTAVWVGASNNNLAVIQRVVSCHGRHRVLLEPTAREAFRLIAGDLLVLDLQQGIRNQIRVF